ncbi:hypothetical protein SPRG_00172 [Saprolegnia parasitica CBS 223.65]|uniref:Carbohydrate kinase PfkB domain-containing protein n=1 Tax=Saprolegnia parasitica (strain CBS 223.65) TaxID=695850 RepID=A0A067CXV4_SAPPC|nr:hypothetical protein SPRG_00172 [Saprolegnia parasitica CBS 223.65]KDO35323.1 hypothetical protein SPRG_00172 [Saprolegnia parasitica CBS 223.65]|eukprot:XP_012193669.1 hypothetical protein SPRG_00172 [Saprolegnia parasitica CBS 223.65]
MMRIAVVGDAFVDVLAGIDALPQWGQDTPCAEAIQMQPGGSALNTATQLANLGGSAVAYFSAMGADGFGDMLALHLAKHNVKSFAPQLASHPTGVCIVLTGQGDRAFVTHYGAAHAFAKQHIPMDRLLEAQHIHVGGFYSCIGLLPDLACILEAAKVKGITISLDTNYDGSEAWTQLDAILPLLDVFLPNEVEAMKISKTSSVDAALDYFASLPNGPKLTVIKVGSDGARAITGQTKTVWHHPCFPTTLLDATGAGDAFNAGFLHAWTADASDVHRALRYGCALGSACVSRLGACTQLPSPETIHAQVQLR